MEIPLEHKIMVLKKMLEMHDTLIWKKEPRHPGLCLLYINSIARIFGGENYLHTCNSGLENIYDALRYSVFEDLDECTMRRRAVQDFDASESGLYWWNVKHFTPRRDFLLNAIQTLEYKLEHNT